MKRVAFTQEQINAIYEQFSVCLECSKLNGEFNSDAFYGAVECALGILKREEYLYLDRYNFDKVER